MTAIRCPECRLINIENVRRCRRCGTPLSPDAEGEIPASVSVKCSRAARHLAVPVIAIVSLLWIYACYKHSKDVPSPGAGLAGTNTAIAESAPTNEQLEGVKRLSRDFMARLDQNAADPKGDGLRKNEALAFDTMEELKEQQNRTTDPAARDYLDDLYRLVEKYHDQVVRLNSEIARLAEVRQRITNEIEQVRQDPSLSPEDKISRQAEIRSELDSESRGTDSAANDIDVTVKSLRNLSAAGIGN
jgi:hypothetical protein